METLSGEILTKVLGWRVYGDFPKLRNPIIFCSLGRKYQDTIIITLYLAEQAFMYKKIPQRLLKEFPLNILKFIKGTNRGNSISETIIEIASILLTSIDQSVLVAQQYNTGSECKLIDFPYTFHYHTKIPVVFLRLDPCSKEIGVFKILQSHECDSNPIGCNAQLQGSSFEKQVYISKN